MNKHGVICAVDVNAYDQDVIDLAADMAKQFGVNLDLIHITLVPNTANKSVYAYIGESSVYGKEHRLLKAITTNTEGVSLNFHHLSGIPSEEVLNFAEQYQPRLLILGTHGRHGLARIFGSVASEILRKASCPVMVLRQRQNNESHAETTSVSQAESASRAS